MRLSETSTQNPRVKFLQLQSSSKSSPLQIFVVLISRFFFFFDLGWWKSRKFGPHENFRLYGIQSWLRLVSTPPKKKGGSDKYSTTSMYIGLWNFITLPDDWFNHISNLYWASSLQTISFFSSHFISSGTTKWNGNGNGKTKTLHGQSHNLW